MNTAHSVFWAAFLACMSWVGHCDTVRKPACLQSEHHQAAHVHDACANAFHTPQVALLFLTRGDLVHEPVWRRWFEEVHGLLYRGCRPGALEAPPDECRYDSHRQNVSGGGVIASQHLFNVYVHTHRAFGGFNYTSIFHGYSIGYHTKTSWAMSSAAMYALVHTALNNPSNAFFVLLSEACVPLYPAAVFYLEVVHSQRSRINGGCDAGEDVPEFGTQQVPQRRLGEAAAEPDWEVWKTATWFLLTRPHAHLVAAYPHKFLLGIADEYYISTLLRTLGRAGETTCDWAGPTYTNWTDPVDPDMDGQSHPRTFHALDGGLLQRMRRSSSFRGVACDWAAGAAAVEWQFSSLLEWTVDAWPPDYAAMPETCPLLARKFAADATPSVIAALWPEAPAPDACAPPRLPRV